MTETKDFGRGAAWVDGEIVPVEEAKISVLDWGLLHSDATYDVAHVWHGRFFRLEDHLDRFERSCAALHLTPPKSRDEIRRIMMACVARSGLTESYVEVLCTRGRSAPGSRDPRSCSNTLVVFAVPFIWIVPPERQAAGAHAIISRIPRIPPESVDPTVKNYHWGDLTRGLFEAYARGGDTVILTDLAGNISEGPGFNVFVVTDGGVRTPGATVLEGITRRTVLEMCEALDIPSAVGPVSPGDVHAADEVFLSSSGGGVLAITRVDERTYGNGRAGPITQRLADAYWALHEDERYATAVDYGA